MKMRRKRAESSNVVYPHLEKHSSLLGLIIVDKGKKFYNIDTWSATSSSSSSRFKAITDFSGSGLNKFDRLPNRRKLRGLEPMSSNFFTAVIYK